jgi:uracil-DNA glycosylase
MQKLKAFLVEQKADGQSRIFPKGSEYFRALDLTPLADVKVVILGQDPYHGAGAGTRAVLQRAVRRADSAIAGQHLQGDCKAISASSRRVTAFWSTGHEQGVLLLNSVLTVEEAQAASHQGKGWETFTDAVIRKVNDECDAVVFILWGAYAQRKAAFVDTSRHLVLKAAASIAAVGA